MSTFCQQSTVPWCLKFIPISCIGPKRAPKDTDLIFRPIYMHWSMCMCSNLSYAHKCTETQLMHKNVQTNPKKFVPQHVDAAP